MFFRSKNLFLRPIWSEDAVALRAAIGELDWSRVVVDAPAGSCGNGGDEGEEAPRLPRCVIARPGGNGEQIVGAAGLFLRDRNVVLELWIDPAHRGRGYGTEAARAMAELAWAAGHEQILATIPPGNVAILRVLRKSGFLPSGSGFIPFGENAILTIPHKRDWSWTGPEMHAA